MRRPLLAAVAATVALSVSPASAAGPGAGAVAVAESSFFRPNNGLVAAGQCTYAGLTLNVVASAETVPPGNVDNLTAGCVLYDAFGNEAGRADGSPLVRNVLSGSATDIAGAVATRICLTVTATSRAAQDVPAIAATSCGTVLPGNVKL